MVMQLMLNICSDEAQLLDFSFNTTKSVGIRIGPRYRHICAPLILSGSAIAYVDQTKYLGVMLRSARCFKCSLDHVKVKFYRGFNAIFHRARNAGTEMVCIHLLKSVCMHGLLHAVEALPLSKSDFSVLDHLLDRAVYRIFGCASSEDIQYVRSVVDLPCVSTSINVRRSKFLTSFSRNFSWAQMILCATVV